VWLFGGRADESAAQLAAARTELPPGFALPNVLVIVAACNIALYEGDAAAASALLATHWTEIEALGVLRFQRLRVELEHLRARVALADRTRSSADRARTVLAIADDLVKEGAPWAVALGLVVKAAAVALEGHAPQALAALHVAEEQLAATQMAGWLQLVRIRLGVLEGTPRGHARAAAARDALREFGVVDPDPLLDVLVPWAP
jgi:ATP/maltotriose-dependent transcriptional regulator MalT